MSTKKEVLHLLEQNKESYISGQELADQIGITRAGVWKAIGNLKKEGYLIDSATNKGYRLLKENDLLSEEGIRVYLDEKYKENLIIVLDSTDSTNSYAKKMAIDGALHGTIITANEQVQGRGRFGRSFYSPEGKGIYLSLILRPQLDLLEVAFSTILTVVAVTRALKAFSGQEIQIKWVNDLFVEGKKISGILTELSHDMESGKVDFVVAGIGINVNAKKQDFPQELKDIAGSIHIERANRNQVIAQICNELLKIFQDFDKKKIIQEYKTMQMVLQKEVVFDKDGVLKTAKAVDIDQDGGLIVEIEGKNETLRSGEISVKIKQ